MAASVSNQLLNLVLSFVSRTIFLQILGVGYLGINGLFSDVLSMLNMAELGFGTAMTFSMYKPLAEKDYDTLAGLTHFYKKVYRIIALTIAVVGVALVPFLPYLINLEQDIPNIELYYLLFLGSNIASYFVVAKTTVLYADQRNHVLIKYSAYWSIIQIVSMLLVLWLTKSYTLYLITQLICVYGQNIHKSIVADRTYPYLKKKVVISKEKTTAIFKDVGSAFLYKISNVLLNATDNTLISILISTEMVGYFSNYSIMVGKLQGIVGTVFYSLIASLGNLIVKENSHRRYHVFQTMQSLSQIICSFCVSCVFLLEEDFICVWLGPEYLLSKLTLIALVTNFYLNVILSPVSSFREAAGLFRKTKFIMLWTATINIALSIVLGKMIGLAGILFATAVAKLLTHFWYEPKLLFQDFFKKPCGLYFVDIARGIIITLVTIVVANVATNWLHPEDWFMLVVKGCMVAIVSLAIVCFGYRKTEGFKMILGRAGALLDKLVNHHAEKDR
jgi:O-antigen/teichoic acid export membrane protein